MCEYVCLFVREKEREREREKGDVSAILNFDEAQARLTSFPFGMNEFHSSIFYSNQKRSLNGKTNLMKHFF